MEYDTIEFCIYADHITLYTYGQSFNEIVEKLERYMHKTCDWFHDRNCEANPQKFSFLLSTLADIPIKIIRSTTERSKGEVLFGVRVDSDLTFKEHITSICFKATQKLQALVTRTSKYMSLQKCHICM